jgi:hypothetical protein
MWCRTLRGIDSDKLKANTVETGLKIIRALKAIPNNNVMSMQFAFAHHGKVGETHVSRNLTFGAPIRKIPARLLCITSARICRRSGSPFSER